MMRHTMIALIVASMVTMLVPGPTTVSADHETTECNGGTPGGKNGHYHETSGQTATGNYCRTSDVTGCPLEEPTIEVGGTDDQTLASFRHFYDVRYTQTLISVSDDNFDATSYFACAYDDEKLVEFTLDPFTGTGVLHGDLHEVVYVYVLTSHVDPDTLEPTFGTQGSYSIAGS